MTLQTSNQIGRSARLWSNVLVALTILVVALSLAGRAVLAGGAAGAATEYAAGKAAQD